VLATAPDRDENTFDTMLGCTPPPLPVEDVWRDRLRASIALPDVLPWSDPRCILGSCLEPIYVPPPAPAPSNAAPCNALALSLVPTSTCFESSACDDDADYAYSPCGLLPVCTLLEESPEELGSCNRLPLTLGKLKLKLKASEKSAPSRAVTSARASFFSTTGLIWSTLLCSSKDVRCSSRAAILASGSTMLMPAY